MKENAKTKKVKYPNPYFYALYNTLKPIKGGDEICP